MDISFKEFKQEIIKRLGEHYTYLRERYGKSFIDDFREDLKSCYDDISFSGNNYLEEVDKIVEYYMEED